MDGNAEAMAINWLSTPGTAQILLRVPDIGIQARL
jgi:hypothetical protein